MSEKYIFSPDYGRREFSSPPNVVRVQKWAGLEKELHGRAKMGWQCKLLVMISFLTAVSISTLVRKR